jgi:uncharacterized alkaline shock family protein YloU
MTAVVEIPADDVTLAQAAVAATRGVPGVVDISRGRYAVARTSGRGGSVVEGIQLTREPEGLRVEVHVVVQPVPLPALAEALRAAIATTLRGLGAPVTAVDVWVDDLRLPATEEETS